MFRSCPKIPVLEKVSSSFPIYIYVNKPYHLISNFLDTPSLLNIKSGFSIYSCMMYHFCSILDLKWGNYAIYWYPYSIILSKLLARIILLPLLLNSPGFRMKLCFLLVRFEKYSLNFVISSHSELVMMNVFGRFSMTSSSSHKFWHRFRLFVRLKFPSTLL